MVKRALVGFGGSGSSGREKQLEYLYSKVLNALRNPTRREILRLLAQRSGERLSFSEIKATFPKLGNASLAHHLRELQMADLVARTVRLEERYKNPDPYYCFYSITSFGKRVIQGFHSVMEEALIANARG